MDDANPRSTLRTVQVLHELANAGHAVPLGVLTARLGLLKTSLIKVLRALQAGADTEADNRLHRVGAAGADAERGAAAQTQVPQLRKTGAAMAGRTEP